MFRRRTWLAAARDLFVVIDWKAAKEEWIAKVRAEFLPRLTNDNRLSDFWLSDYRLTTELDNVQHHGEVERDTEKAQVIYQAAGFRTKHVWELMGHEAGAGNAPRCAPEHRRKMVF